MPQNPSKAEIQNWVAKVAAAYGVPVAIVMSVMDFESNFVQWRGGSVLRSPAGAVGLMQKIPGDSFSKGLDVVGSWQDNVVSGVRELAFMYRHTGNWHDAYAGYNGGLGNVNGATEQRNATSVIQQARNLYGWKGDPGNPNPNAGFDPNASNRSFGDFHPMKWMGNYTHGNVPYHAMVKILDAPGHAMTNNGFYLRPDAAASWFTMVAAARRDGVNLDHYLVSAYRNFTPNSPKAAPLSKSDHGLGGAIDVDSNSPAFHWIAQHGSQFGWSVNGASWGDPGHFSFGAGGFDGGGSDINPPTAADRRWIDQVAFTNGRFFINSPQAPPNTQPPGGFFPTSPGSGGRTDLGGSTAAGLEGVLRGLGLAPHAFDDLIDKAIRGQWTPARFEAAVYGSKQFHSTFPGIFRDDGSLRMTPASYLSLSDQYRKLAQGTGVQLDRGRIGLLIQGEKSPDEWNNDLQVLQQVRSSDQYRKMFNQELQASGHKPLGPGDWFHFIAGRATPLIYDLYEAAHIRQLIGTGAQGSLKVARGLNAPGEFSRTQDLQQLAAQVEQDRAFVGPELKANGISRADLALLRSGQDPRHLAPLLNQILRNRQALAGAVPRATQAPSQSVGLFPAAHEGL